MAQDGGRPRTHRGVDEALEPEPVGGNELDRLGRHDPASAARTLAATAAISSSDP